MNIIEVKNCNYSVVEKNLFGKKQQKEILSNISFEIEKEKIVGIAGESGSGKTTLAKILAGIIKPTSGKISINVADEWKTRKTNPVQLLFQNSGDIINPLREIDDIIDEAIKIRFGAINAASKKQVLDAVKFDNRLWQRKGFELSGGEQQRVALARLLAVQPEVLILDEPFSAQDPASQLNLLKLFKSINTQFKITMICISHNLKALRFLCDSIIVIYKGQIVEHGRSHDIFEKPQHAYTKFLLQAEDYSLEYEEIKNKIDMLKSND